MAKLRSITRPIYVSSVALLLALMCPVSATELTEILRAPPVEGESSCHFGVAAKLDANTLVYGVYLGKPVCVLVRDDSGNWTQQAELIGEDTEDGDSFGSAVSVSGDTVIVGAPNADGVPSTGENDNHGAVYVFVRDALGAWSQQAKLTASNGGPMHFFGAAIDIDADTLIVGSRNTPDGEPLGSAYVFVRDANGNWMEQAELQPTEQLVDRERFGCAVAIDGGTVVVGARGFNDPNRLLEPWNENGSAFVFIRDETGNWTQQANLTEPLESEAFYGSPGIQHNFGASVDVESELVIVGAPGWNDETSSTNGSTWLFARDDSGAWYLQAELLASDPPPMNYGAKVSIEDGVAIVGAAPAYSAGRAYVFARDPSGVWQQQATLLTSDQPVPDEFGLSWDGFGTDVTSDANTAVITGYDDVDVTYFFDLSILQIHPPAFASTPVMDASQDVTYVYDVETEHLDPEPVVISAATLPAWTTLIDNSDGTATLTGTPTNAEVGDHAVSLEVTDGTYRDTQDFTITVADVNDAPSFTSTAPTAATEGDEYSYAVTVEDPETDTVTIAGTTLPGWLTLTDNGDNTATLTGTPTGAYIGDNDVVLTADDGNTGVSEQGFTIAVMAAEDGPVIAINGDATVTITVGDTYADAGATASDPQDGDLTAQIVVDNPVDPNSAGTYTVTYTVEDSAGNQAQAQRTVTIEAAPPPPPPPVSPSGGSGGSTSPIELLTLGLMLLFAAAAGRNQTSRPLL